MKITDYKDFSAKFIERYSASGFGSMNKNDFEVMLFDLLKRFGDLKNKTHYQASMLLRIPESKVRRLAYEADLKYGNLEESDIKTAFFSLIAHVTFRAEGNKIQFAVEDKFLQTSIAAKLKELGHFADSSFNCNVVSINIDSFIALLEAYYPKEATERIVKECRESVVPVPGEDISFKRIMGEFLKGAANQAGKKVVDLCYLSLTGGAGAVSDLIDLINKKE